MDISLELKHQEESFIQACINKEKWAQQKLYEDHYGKMMGVCLRYAGSKEEALDILHDGFIKVFRNIKNYKPGTSINAWIRRIMVNTAIDYYRKQTRRRTEDLDQAYGLQSGGASALANCSAKDILDCIQKLSPAYRSVFNLYIIEGYSHREIAKILKITESTSRSNLVKARIKLKKLLSELKGVYGR